MSTPSDGVRDLSEVGLLTGAQTNRGSELLSYGGRLRVVVAVDVGDQEALYVGDRVVEDYEGPRRLGMRAILCAALAATTLGTLVTGAHVNLEADVLAKYVERLVEVR